jgi:hypothetical protein
VGWVAEIDAIRLRKLESESLDYNPSPHFNQDLPDAGMNRIELLVLADLADLPALPLSTI